MATTSTAPPVHVTVTGAAGQIGYALLFRIASGQLLGPDQPVVRRLLEIEPAMKALKGGVPVSQLTHVAIWGNHSTTQFPDFAHARIQGRPAPEVIADDEWLRGRFLETVQKRGAAVIDARGASSAGSAANAVIDSVAGIRTPTAGDDWMSVAVVSGGQYGVPEGLIFGYPVRSKGSSWPVVEGLEHDDFAREKLRLTTEELLAERQEVTDLLA